MANKGEQCTGGRGGCPCRGLYTPDKRVRACSYFHVTGFTYGLTAVSTVLFSVCQSWGRATAPLPVNLPRLPISVIGGRMLL
jgi:Na+-driven multidrug efflux pump